MDHHALLASANVPPAAPDGAAAMLQEAAAAIARRCMVTLLAVLLGVYVTLAASYPRLNSWPLFLTVLICCTLIAASWRLVRSHSLLGPAVFLLALSLAITWPAVHFAQPALLLCLALLPLLAAILIGQPAGALAWLLPAVTAAAVAVAQAEGLAASPFLPAGLVLAALAALLGGSAMYVYRDLALGLFDYFETAQRELHELRARQEEWKQTEADVLHANRELQRMSLRLRALSEAAEEARSVKEAFVANVSHELRTPLNMIISFSEMITQTPRMYGTRLPSALLADIAVIQRNSRHLSRLVDDVLDLSQLDVGEMALEKGWLDIRELVEAAMHAVRPLFEGKKLYLRLDVPPGLPKIFCDGTRIKQVVINLLSNAGRFTETGGVTLRLALEEAWLVLAVADTGPGIAAEDQGKIFEPFQQLESAMRLRYGGSGLGLSISKHLVEMHGGNIRVESSEGGGATFFVALPLRLPNVQPPDAGALRWLSGFEEPVMQARPHRTPADPPPERFVVLEPGHTFKRLLERHIHDAEVKAVQTIEEAVAALDRSPARALVANLDAVEKAAAIAARLPYATPLIMCRITLDDPASSLGAQRYLVKPVDGETLRRTLADVAPTARRVLIIDDEPDLLHLFTRMLAAGEPTIQVLTAGSGREGWLLLQEAQPDVVVLDLVMPEMSGFEFLRHKQADAALAAIPTVVISSRDPGNRPIICNQLTIAHGQGMAATRLLECVQAVSAILNPANPAPGQRRKPYA